MLNRLQKVVKLFRDLSEVPARLVAIEERIKQLESPNRITINPTPYVPYIPYVPQQPIWPGDGTGVNPNPYPVIITTDRITIGGMCVDGCEYPNPWFGINPPPCNKCGIAPPPSHSFTCCSHENISITN